MQVSGYDEERDGALQAILEFCSICERQNRRGAKARKGRRGGGSDALGLADLVI